MDMRLLLIGFLLLILSNSAFAQTGSDTIRMKKVLGGYQLTRHNRPVKMPQLAHLVESNPSASAELRKARTNKTFGDIISGAGGFLVGYTLGTAIAGKDPEWAIAGTGLGLIVVSIPFTVACNRHLRSVVGQYNASVRKTTFRDRLELNLCASGNRIGLSLSF